MDIKVLVMVNNIFKKLESNNVIVILLGVEFFDEYIIYMVYWDYLGKDESKEGD